MNGSNTLSRDRSDHSIQRFSLQGNFQSANSSSVSPAQQTAIGAIDDILGLMCASMVPGEAPNIVEGDLVTMGAAVGDQSEFNSMQVGSCTVEGIDGALDPNSSEPVQATVWILYLKTI